MVEQLTQLNTQLDHALPDTLSAKTTTKRRANLLSTKRNLAALTKEDQGSQRKLSGLGTWRSSVAIALPSCCFAESRFFLSLLRTQQAKNERTRYADVVVGRLRLVSAPVGGRVYRPVETLRDTHGAIFGFKSSGCSCSSKPIRIPRVSLHDSDNNLCLFPLHPEHQPTRLHC